MKSINLQNGGINESSASNILLLLGQFENLEAIDVSDNGALGTSGAARLLEGLGKGMKSVSLKGTGLGLPAGSEPVAPQVAGFGSGFGSSASPFGAPSTSMRKVCSDEDWARLEGALRGLSALEAIDVSDNGALGTSGVGRLVSCCAGEAFACATWLLRFVACVCDVVLQGAWCGCRLVAA